jgi:hypothetical protein
MAKPEKMKSITFRVPESLHRHLRMRAAKDCQPIQETAGLALRDYLIRKNGLHVEQAKESVA